MSLITPSPPPPASLKSGLEQHPSDASLWQIRLRLASSPASLFDKALAAVPHSACLWLHCIDNAVSTGAQAGGGGGAEGDDDDDEDESEDSDREIPETSVVSPHQQHVLGLFKVRELVGVVWCVRFKPFCRNMHALSYPVSMSF